MPDAPTRWRLDVAGVRGLVSLGLAALVGALVVALVGWPRGDEAPAAALPPVDSDVLRNPADSQAERVVVDVDGAVRRPGVVELRSGDRVVDALDAAGGVLPRGDTGALNLAEVLLDGQQVVVPRRGAVKDTVPTESAVPAPGAGLVNLNTATETELDTLPGIGPVLAAAIVEWRAQNGGFASIDQLQEVSGIGPATFADLAPLVRV